MYPPISTMAAVATPKTNFRFFVAPTSYIHAKRMYDVGATKNRKLVFGVATAAIVLIGGYIPVFAIQFQVRARARRATRGRGRDARIP